MVWPCWPSFLSYLTRPRCLLAVHELPLLVLVSDVCMRSPLPHICASVCACVCASFACRVSVVWYSTPPTRMMLWPSSLSSCPLLSARCLFRCCGGRASLVSFRFRRSRSVTTRCSGGLPFPISSTLRLFVQTPLSHLSPMPGSLGRLRLRTRAVRALHLFLLPAHSSDFSAGVGKECAP